MNDCCLRTFFLNAKPQRLFVKFKLEVFLVYVFYFVYRIQDAVNFVVVRNNGNLLKSNVASFLPSIKTTGSLLSSFNKRYKMFSFASLLPLLICFANKLFGLFAKVFARLTTFAKKAAQCKMKFPNLPCCQARTYVATLPALLVFNLFVVFHQFAEKADNKSYKYN